jgi:predicted transcriptional regulator
MATANIRISSQGREMLRELARKERQPMGAILERALEKYRRASFLEEANAAYAALRSDRKGWADELAERKLWDSAGADGLESE